ncbi:MAG: Fic family protein [Terrimicrobiaceae bacterium]
MPFQIPAEDFEVVRRAVGRFSAGATVGELLKVPEVIFPKRTLQRRLEQLVSEGRLAQEGNGRARRYRVPAEGVPLVGPGEAGWLSAKSLEIREAIQRPVSRRTPVGYRKTFLDSYQPNRTFYLPSPLRRELEKIGQVGLADLPAGTYLRQVLDRLLIDLSWNSSRLEGNTYSLLETERLLELGENAEGKNAQETQMLLNHKAAIEMLADQAGEIGFNRYTICNLHALLSDNLLAEPAAGGRIRSRPVGISGTVFHPLEVPQRVEECLDLILEKAEAISDPLEQAFFVMVQLPYLQPFEDVNKRVSRLAANIPLIRKNLCPLSFIDVEQGDYLGGLIGVYELNRVDYLRDVFAWAYRRSCARYSAVRQSLGEPDPFRLRHRLALVEVIGEVVRGGMNKRAAAKHVRRRSEQLAPAADSKRFATMAEAELHSLHDGNFARFRLRPSEFTAWKAHWK